MANNNKTIKYIGDGRRETKKNQKEVELNSENLIGIKNDIEKLLLKAGQIILKGYNSPKKDITTKKHEQDYLTKYDILVNTLIINHLKKKYPNFSIISEESPEIKGNNTYSFVIDPIDGTRNFIRKIPTCFCGIGLIKNNKTIFCMTYNPISNDLFWAIEKKGSYWNNKKIKVSSRDKLSISDVIYRNLSKTKSSIEIQKKLYSNVYSLKDEMCCHYETSSVACSRYDAVIQSGSKIWDYAQYLLIKEAGGKVTDFDGKEFDLSKKELLGSNGLIHNQLLKLLK